MTAPRVIASLIAFVLLAGCASRKAPPVAEVREHPAAETISVPDLATALGLAVREETSRGATLENAANTVTLFSPPGGRVYVNGESVGGAGAVVAGEAGLRVDAALAPVVATLLLPEPASRALALGRTRPRVPTEDRAFLGRVVIDPGHGGKDDGATGVNGLREKHVVLDVSDRIARLLRAEGLDVSMTRDSDRFIELDDRVAFGNRRRPLVFVSIHADSFTSSRPEGFSVYVARKAPADSLRAAKAIRAALRRTGVTDRGVKRGDFRVLKNAAGPAVLVELGFLSNRADAQALASAGHRGRLAQAVADGIFSYLDEVGRGK